jgi:hypothetical protein
LKVKVEDLKLYHARRVKHSSSPQDDSLLGNKDVLHRTVGPHAVPAVDGSRTDESSTAPSTTGSREPGLRPRFPPPVPESSFPTTGLEAADFQGDDPNRSFVVDRILSHRRHGRQYLYLVRWAPPYDGREHDCEVNARAFDRKPGDKVAPALREYWLDFPAHLRPVAYRRLGNDAPVASVSIAKRRRGRSTTDNDASPVHDLPRRGAPGVASSSSTAPVQNRAKKRRKR